MHVIDLSEWKSSICKCHLQVRNSITNNLVMSIELFVLKRKRLAKRLAPGFELAVGFVLYVLLEGEDVMGGCWEVVINGEEGLSTNIGVRL